MPLIDEAKELLIDCASSTRLTAEILFPERFSRVWTNLHLQIFDLLDNSDNPKKAIIAPRGIGKTSIANLLIPAKAALFVEQRYIVPISATSTLATQQSENLKDAISRNSTIRKLFGDVSSKIFNKEQWVLNIGGSEQGTVCVMPRGAGQQVRGQLFRGIRPGLIIADDLEDPQEMDSEDMRKKKKVWFYDDVMKSVDNYARPIPWEIIVVNTMLHQDSLAADLLENPDWDTLELSICDDDLKSNIPEWLSDADIKQIYDEHIRQHNMEGFFREFRNMPNVSGEFATFQKGQFRYYDEASLKLNNNADVENMILVDPARTKNPKSAHSAVVGVAASYRSNQIYVREVVADHLHPEEMHEEIFAMAARINAKVIGIEVTGLGEYATYSIINEISRRNLHIEVIELHARAGKNEDGKNERIKGLIPFYRQGLIWHNPLTTNALEAQLMSFPNAKRRDIMDALAYVVELLAKGERFMLPGGDGSELPTEIMPYSQEQAEKEMSSIMGRYNTKREAPLSGFRVI